MSDFVAGPIARRKKERTKYLVMWTWPILADASLGERMLKWAGGMEHPAEHGNIEQTWREEVEEETGLTIRPDAQIDYLTFVHHGEHTKHFMMAWRRDCDGTLRKVPMRDGRTLLEVPFFAERNFLEKHLHGDHRVVLKHLPE